MTEGKLECSCAEQMELAALFSADLIGPLANSLDVRNPLGHASQCGHRVLHPEALQAIIDMIACTQSIHRELSQSWNREATRPDSIDVHE